jgi:hypothetical protein
MAEEVLQAPGVHSARRQGVPSRVAQHVHMDGEEKLSSLAGALDQFVLLVTAPKDDSR